MLPPGWDASPSQGYPQHYAGTHLYTWVERGTVRVKCLAQERNTMSPARPRTQTTRSGVERTNHEATAPPSIMTLNHPFVLPPSFARPREELVAIVCFDNRNSVEVRILLFKGPPTTSVLCAPLLLLLSGQSNRPVRFRNIP